MQLRLQVYRYSEESTGCTCDVCGLKDAKHCSGYATCGEFHSDNMLYGTAETAVFVEEYARDESAFFRDYQAGVYTRPR
jgi:hypothetical protein